MANRVITYQEVAHQKNINVWDFAAKFPDERVEYFAPNTGIGSDVSTSISGGTASDIVINYWDPTTEKFKFSQINKFYLISYKVRPDRKMSNFNNFNLILYGSIYAHIYGDDWDTYGFFKALELLHDKSASYSLFILDY